MNFNIIGAGRLGKNIALALSTSGLGTLRSICNKSKESAALSCSILGLGTAAETIRKLPAADILWITCNDDSISSVIQALTASGMPEGVYNTPVHRCEINSDAANSSKQTMGHEDQESRYTLNPGTFIIHCSGVLSSEILAPLKQQGCFIASFHPMKAFNSHYLDHAAFKGVDCVVEGDEVVCDWLKRTFQSLGAYVNTINPESKAAYHAAACMVSNYLITLGSCGEELLLQSGIPSAQVQRIIRSLFKGALTNVEQGEKSAESLSGPLVRGDIGTVSLHLNAIENQSIKNLYKAAGLATLPLTQLPEEKKQVIQSILEPD